MTIAYSCPSTAAVTLECKLYTHSLCLSNRTTRVSGAYSSISYRRPGNIPNRRVITFDSQTIDQAIDTLNKHDAH